MSKAIRWQLHFHEAKPDSQNPKHYRVDIYDEQDGTWSGITQLTAGDQPFVTDEDASDDFFCPVRTQTGTLQICTLKPDGQYITLDELLPANNIARPVKVWQLLGGGAAGILEWQGFMSCEAYSHNYTGLPENISFPVLSVLEAWKSIDYTVQSQVESISQLFSDILTLGAQSINGFANVKIPKDAIGIWDALINTSIFIEKVEFNNEESFVYKTKGASLHDILSEFCKFMGWTAREVGSTLYIQSAEGDYYDADMVTVNMESLNWSGTGHQRSISAGAKPVKTSTKLEQLDIDTGIPEIPYGDLRESTDQQIQDPVISQMGPWVYMLPSVQDNAYSNLQFHHMAGDITIGSSANEYAFSRVSMPELETRDVVEESIPHANTLSQAYIAYSYRTQSKRIFAGAFLARVQIDPYDDHDEQHQDTKDGLYVSLFPNAYGTADPQPIFEMSSIQAFAAAEEGYLNLQAVFKTFWDTLAVNATGSNHRYMFELQVGDRYWDADNGTWTTVKTQLFPENDPIDQTKFVGNWDASMEIDEVDGICIPTFFTENGTKKMIMGRVTLRIYPETRRYTSVGPWENMVQGVFFEQLDIAYYPKKSAERTDRSDNNYYRDLGTAFRDDVSIELSLSTWLHNNSSPSLLFKPDGTAPLQRLDDIGRPEIHLLNRLASYYGAARQRLELEVAHPTDAPLPLLRLNGINDGKVYLPLSESRDWQTDVCKLTCFELPEQPSES